MYQRKKVVVEKVAEEFRRLIASRYSDYIVYAYLFGSLVEGRATEESDIDIAIRFYDHVQRETRWRVVKEILGIISEDIDIVDLDRASPVLRMVVYSRGRLIYCRDRWILFLDQNKTIKLYNDYLHIARPYYRKMVEYLEKRTTKKIQ